MGRVIGVVLAATVAASLVSGAAATDRAAAADGGCGRVVTARGTGPTQAFAEVQGFADVDASSFAVADIACLRGLGITTGTSPTTFEPGAFVTREQMAAFLARLWRAVGETCGGSTQAFAEVQGFADVDASSFAVADIACLRGLGITTGTSPTTFEPGAFVTREQMAAFVARTWRQVVRAGCGDETTVRAPATAYDFAAVTSLVQEFVDENALSGAGLIVVQGDDCVIRHEHWGGFDRDRVSLVASSSKMISAGVLLHLADDGLLDMDAPVADVVSWGSANPDITPAQLVSNSSGLIGLAFGIPSPYYCQFRLDEALQSCAEAIFTTADDDPDVIPPDTEFRYGGAQWQVAGAVAEVASGRTWRELIDEIYVAPCGADSLVFGSPFEEVFLGGSTHAAVSNGGPSPGTDVTNPNIEGGAYITSADYGTLLLMHLRDGRCGGDQVLSPEALALAHGDRIGSVYSGDADGPDTGYGLGWYVDRESGRLTAPGAYGTVAWLDLDDGYGAYLALEADAAVGERLAEQLIPVIEESVTGFADR
ncbi:MAG: serine hydrolase [Acidimicrobiales bacterium]